MKQLEKRYGKVNEIKFVMYVIKEKMVKKSPQELILIKTHYGFNQKLKMIFQFHQIFEKTLI